MCATKGSDGDRERFSPREDLLEAVGDLPEKGLCSCEGLEVTV